MPDLPAPGLVPGVRRWVGGDDAADALRYLVATKVPEIVVRKLRGL